MAILQRIPRWTVVLPVAITVLACGGETADRPESTITVLSVTTVTAEFRDSYGAKRTYTGKLVPRRSVDLGFEFGGKVSAITVDEGHRVRAGAVLASLDTALLVSEKAGMDASREAAHQRLTELRNGPRAEEIAAARAQLEAEAALAENLVRQKSRLKLLLDRATVSEEAYEDIGYRAKSAANRRDAARHRLNELLAGTRPERIAAQEASVRALDAKLDHLAIRIDKSTVRAPFDGTVARRDVDEGAAVAASQSILRLVESAPFEARVSLPVGAAQAFAAAAPRELSIGGRRHPARLISRLPVLDPKTLNVLVVFEVGTESSGELFAGQLARVTVAREVRCRGAWLPTTSLVKGVRGLWSCFALVAEAEGSSFRVQRRDVEVLHAEADRVFLRGTVEPGDLIIRTGAHRVSHGQIVTLARTGADRGEAGR